MKTIFTLCIGILICFSGCQKKSDTVDSSGIHIFKGIVVTDDIGQVLGIWGNEDGDWGNDANWSAAEFDLLNFPDTISLDDTYIKDTTGWNNVPGAQQPKNFVLIFPNPTQKIAMLIFNGLGVLKFKAAIVDKLYNRLTTIASKTYSGNHIMIGLNFSDSTKFQEGVYRIYYSFSATDSLNFYKGHGDILVCRSAVWQECKNLVP